MDALVTRLFIVRDEWKQVQNLRYCLHVKPCCPQRVLDREHVQIRLP